MVRDFILRVACSEDLTWGEEQLGVALDREVQGTARQPVRL